MLRRSAVIFFVTVMLLLAAEACVRQRAPDWAWLEGFPIRDGAAVCVRPVPGRAGRFTGLGRALSRPVPFTIHPSGHRGASAPAVSAPRFAVFGASNVFGLGVADGHDWPSRVDGLEGVGAVRNYAVPGHDALQQLAYSVEVMRRVGAREGMLTLVLDDLSPMDCQAWRRAITPLTRRSSLWRLITLRPESLRGSTEPQVLDRSLDRLVSRRSVETSGPVTALVLGRLGRTLPEHQERVDRLRRGGWRVRDVSVALEPVFSQHVARYWNEIDEQLSDDGHRLIAARVAEALREPAR